MKKLMMLVIYLSFVATNALAQKLPSIQAAQDTDTDHTNAKLDYFEGFEGAVPPDGWTHGVTNEEVTWEIDVLSEPYSGLQSVIVGRHPTEPQDETLSFTWPVDNGDFLYFVTRGNPYFCENIDFTVEINGSVVYDYCEQGYTSIDLWELGTIDLAAYENTSPTFTFRYTALSGTSHWLDAVRIGDTPPLPNDTGYCDLVSQDTGIHFTGNTCGGQNLVFNLGCAAYVENGLEHYYEIQVPDGCHFSATATNSVDGALWLLENCAAPNGVYTCLAYADATSYGEAETVNYMNESGSDQIVYLVIDSWGTESCGDYSLDFVTDCAVAVEGTNFGSLKSMFR